jgi:hypothetical protein
MASHGELFVDVHGQAVIAGSAAAARRTMLTRSAKWSSLKAWAFKLAQRRGLKRAKVALARNSPSSFIACGGIRQIFDSPQRQTSRPPRHEQEEEKPSGEIGIVLARTRLVRTMAQRDRPTPGSAKRTTEACPRETKNALD